MGEGWGTVSLKGERVESEEGEMVGGWGGVWGGVIAGSFQALEVEKEEMRKISCCFQKERGER